MRARTLLIGLLHALRSRMNRMLLRRERRAPATADPGVSTDARSDASDSLATGVQPLDGAVQDLRLFPGKLSAGPPAHWLELVQRRAPGLLDSLGHRTVAPPAGHPGADGARRASLPPAQSAFCAEETEVAPGMTGPVSGSSRSGAQAEPRASRQRPAAQVPTPRLRSTAKQPNPGRKRETEPSSKMALHSERPGETLHTASAREQQPGPGQETAAETGFPREKGRMHEPRLPVAPEPHPVTPHALSGEEVSGCLAQSSAGESRPHFPPFRTRSEITAPTAPAIEDRRAHAKMPEPISHKLRLRPAAETSLEGAAQARDLKNEWVVAGEDRASRGKRDPGSDNELLLDTSSRAVPRDPFAAPAEPQVPVVERPFVLGSHVSADEHSSRAAPPAPSYHRAPLPPRTATGARRNPGETEPPVPAPSWPTLPDELVIPDAGTVGEKDERWPDLLEPTSGGAPSGGFADGHASSVATLRRAEHRRHLDLEQRGVPWNG